MPFKHNRLKYYSRQTFEAPHMHTVIHYIQKGSMHWKQVLRQFEWRLLQPSQICILRCSNPMLTQSQDMSWAFVITPYKKITRIFSFSTHGCSREAMREEMHTTDFRPSCFTNLSWPHLTSQDPNRWPYVAVRFAYEFKTISAWQTRLAPVNCASYNWK